MIKNKVIFAKGAEGINELIAKENANGWVVKYIACMGEGGGLTRNSGIYALLEKNG